MTDTLSLVLFSGTDDKLYSAGALVAAAAAIGKRVNVFLQWWALDAFRADRIEKDHGVSAEAGPEGTEALRRLRHELGQHWSDLFRDAQEIGDVRITACAHSTGMFGVTKEDLDPMVDEVTGVASFMAQATGPVLYI